MKLELVTLLGETLSEDIYEVVLPTENGEISVFPGHEPLVSLAKVGVITVRCHKQDVDSALQYFATDGGIIEISPSRVRVLVDEAAAGDDIVEAESKAALERALTLRAEATDQVSLEHATQLIDRHAVRLKVAELHRRHRRG